MRQNSKLLLIILVCIIIPTPAHAWDGYDYDRGTYVEIEKGNLVRQGREIEFYDYDTGEYHDVEVESITRSGNSVEIEVYDQSTGEHRTLEMED